MNSTETAHQDALHLKMQRVYHLLVAAYGLRRWSAGKHMAPLDELVLTILSQHTSDVNSIRAFEELRQRLPTWDEVANVSLSELADAIRSGGLAVQKAPRIQAALRAIHERSGGYALDFLKHLSLEDARAYLTSLKGVGPKTAAIVLLFSLGRPALPVDTHVHRVSQRLGLIGPRTSEAQAHAILEPLLEPEQMYTFHIDMITHGRQVCKAQRPLCEICPLQSECDYYQHGNPQLANRQPPALGKPATVHGLNVADDEEID
jgi:endonuclease-3